MGKTWRKSEDSDSDNTDFHNRKFYQKQKKAEQQFYGDLYKTPKKQPKQNEDPERWDGMS